MVSVGVSKLGCTTVHFFEPGVGVNGESQQSTWTEVTARHTPVIPRRDFCVLTGRRPRTLSTRHHHFPGATDARLRTSDTVAAEFARNSSGRL